MYLENFTATWESNSLILNPFNVFTIQELSCFYLIVDPPSNDWWQSRTEENQDTGEVCGWGESHDLLLNIMAYSVMILRLVGNVLLFLCVFSALHWRGPEDVHMESCGGYRLQVNMTLSFILHFCWFQSLSLYILLAVLSLDCETFNAVLLKLLMNFN